MVVYWSYWNQRGTTSNNAMYSELLFRRLFYGKKDCHKTTNYKAAA